MTLTDTLAALEKATPDCSIDRPSNAPGGMECEQCGVIFVGGEEHSICGKCYAYNNAERLGMAFLRSPEFAELAKDAGRWRWLRENCGYSGSGNHTGAQVIVYYADVSGGKHGIAYTGPKQRVGILALDAAIDQAIAQAGAAGGE